MISKFKRKTDLKIDFAASISPAFPRQDIPEKQTGKTLAPNLWAISNSEAFYSLLLPESSLN